MTIPAGFAQVNLFFTGASAPNGMQVTCGLDVQSYSADATSAAIDVGDALGASNLDSLTCADINLTRILVKFGPDATGPSGEFAFSGVGTLGEALAPNTAVLVAKSTADGGRAGRGRLYWPAAEENQVSSAGILSPTPLDDLQDAFATFRTTLIASNLDPVVLHQPGAPIVEPSPITAFTVQALVATQRRRLRP